MIHEERNRERRKSTYRIPFDQVSNEKEYVIHRLPLVYTLDSVITSILKSDSLAAEPLPQLVGQFVLDATESLVAVVVEGQHDAGVVDRTAEVFG